MSNEEYEAAKTALLKKTSSTVTAPEELRLGELADKESLDLEKLRLELLKRAEGINPDKIKRAIRYFERRKKAAEEGKYSVNVINSYAEERTDGAVFKITLDIDVYAPEELIEKDLLEHVMRHVRQWREARNSMAVPEIHPLKRKITQGSRYDLNFIAECLAVHDMMQSKTTVKEIAEILFSNDADYDSARQKVHQRNRKAKKLILLAEAGLFP